MRKINLKIASKSKESDSHLSAFQDSLFLSFLDFESFKIVCSFCCKNRISSRELRSFSKDQDLSTFKIENIIGFLKEKCLLSSKNLSPFYCSSYYMAKFGCSEEEAKVKLQSFKSDKSTSLGSFIKRHGEEVGREKFALFQKTSSFTCSEERFKSLYGDNWKEEKSKFHKESSSASKYFYLKRGMTEEEATKAVLDRQLNKSGLFKEYWANQCYSDTEITEIFEEINLKKGKHNRNMAHMKEEYGENWKEEWLKIHDQIRSNMESKGKWIKSSEMPHFDQYKAEAWVYTEMSICEDGLKGIELRSKDFHVDHIFSLKEGYKNRIHPKIIGSICNLALVSSLFNSKKGAKCGMSEHELLVKYRIFEREKAASKLDYYNFVL